MAWFVIVGIISSIAGLASVAYALVRHVWRKVKARRELKRTALATTVATIVTEALKPVHYEFSDNNGGTSLKERVTRTELTVLQLSRDFTDMKGKQYANDSTTQAIARSVARIEGRLEGMATAAKAEGE